MKILGIIPARYASTRFPGKPLIEILGKSMLQRVYEQAKKSKLLTDVVIATDDERIATHAKAFGANVVMTKAEHPSGTDRSYEAYLNTKTKYDYIINIQGDEPFIDPSQIDLLAGICDGNTELATLMIKCNDQALLETFRQKWGHRNLILCLTAAASPFVPSSAYSKYAE